MVRLGEKSDKHQDGVSTYGIISDDVVNLHHEDINLLRKSPVTRSDKSHQSKGLMSSARINARGN